LLIQYQSSVTLLSCFLRGLAKILSIVPNTELILSNSTFDDLSCDSGESLVDTKQNKTKQNKTK